MRLQNSVKASLSIRQKFTFTVIGIGALLAGITGVLSVQQSLSIDLHSTPTCGVGYSSYELAWGTTEGFYNWSPGSLSENFSYVDGSATTFRFSYSGETSKLGSIGTGQTPNIQDFFSGGNGDALSHVVTTGFTGGGITLTIDIIPAIPATMAFDLYHINGDAAGGDQVSIHAVPEAGGSNIYPTLIDNGTPSWEDDGNGTADANNINVTSNNAHVGVEFNSATLVDQLVITWTNCDICGTGMHGMGIGNMEFCSTPAPDQDNDGVPDYEDIDDDNDGIPDTDEYCIMTSPPSTVDITVEVQLDGYPAETSWVLKEGTTTVMSGGSYVAGDANTLISDTYTGSPGAYTFVISDSYGDGLCCNDPGYYQVKVNGTVVVGPVGWTTGSTAAENFTASVDDFHCLAGNPNGDDDYDGIPNYQDSDFCTLNAAGVCESLDSDGDGIIASMDLDADNDGIPDIVEARGADNDGDGFADDLTDTNGNGLVDVFETAAGNTSTLFDSNGDGTNDDNGDFDGDNIPNWLDLDSDGDGIVDVIEAGGNDANADGIIDNPLNDTDNDGYADGVDGDVGNDLTAENSANSLVKTSSDTDSDGQPNSGYPEANTDGDDVPDFLDIDADNDGIVDNTEAQATASYIAPDNVDADGDGIDDAYDSNDAAFGGMGLVPVNTDLADEPDYLDTDSDNDMESDLIEGHDSDGDGFADSSSPAGTGMAAGIDIDVDGLDDGFDNDPASTDATNSSLNPGSHPAVDGGSNRDWRFVPPGSFPVEWLSFEAVWLDNSAEITWETASEMNADYFQVERQVEGSGLFEAIGTVKAAGNSSTVQSYAFTDRRAGEIGPDKKLFYRLRQTDIDGTFTYSDVVELFTRGIQLSMKVYPNPATNKATVTLPGSIDTWVNIQVIGMDGKTVFTDQVNTASGNVSVNLDVSQWTSGVYQIIASDNQSRISKQLIVR